MAIIKSTDPDLGEIIDGLQNYKPATPASADAKLAATRYVPPKQSLAGAMEEIAANAAEINAKSDAKLKARAIDEMSHAYQVGPMLMPDKHLKVLVDGLAKGVTHDQIRRLGVLPPEYRIDPKAKGSGAPIGEIVQGYQTSTTMTTQQALDRIRDPKERATVEAILAKHAALPPAPQPSASAAPAPGTRNVSPATAKKEQAQDAQIAESKARITEKATEFAATTAKSNLLIVKHLKDLVANNGESAETRVAAKKQLDQMAEFFDVEIEDLTNPTALLSWSTKLYGAGTVRGQAGISSDPIKLGSDGKHYIKHKDGMYTPVTE